MGILSGLLGGEGGLLKGAGDIIDKFVESPSEKNAMAVKTQLITLKPLLEQIETNKLEAQHASVFVAGARPATLWLCALCMGGIVAAGVFGWWTGKDVSALYALYGATVAPVHLGLLGLRTYERARGQERNAIGVKS